MYESESETRISRGHVPTLPCRIRQSGKDTTLRRGVQSLRVSPQVRRATVSSEESGLSREELCRHEETIGWTTKDVHRPTHRPLPGDSLEGDQPGVLQTLEGRHPHLATVLLHVVQAVAPGVGRTAAPADVTSNDRSAAPTDTASVDEMRTVDHQARIIDQETHSHPDQPVGRTDPRISGSRYRRALW